jgi:hypothetical protein
MSLPVAHQLIEVVKNLPESLLLRDPQLVDRILTTLIAVETERIHSESATRQLEIWSRFKHVPVCKPKPQLRLPETVERGSAASMVRQGVLSKEEFEVLVAHQEAHPHPLLRSVTLKRPRTEGALVGSACDVRFDPKRWCPDVRRHLEEVLVSRPQQFRCSKSIEDVQIARVTFTVVARRRRTAGTSISGVARVTDILRAHGRTRYRSAACGACPYVVRVCQEAQRRGAQCIFNNKRPHFDEPDWPRVLEAENAVWGTYVA